MKQPKQPQEIYVVNVDVKVDMMNPEKNVFLIPLERKFKCIQGGEGGKVIYRQVTRYFKESE